MVDRYAIRHYRDTPMSEGRAEYLHNECRAIRLVGAQERPQLLHALVMDVIYYASDEKNWGVPDYWATPKETIIAGKGDCEDIAILEWWLAQDCDIPAYAPRIVIGTTPQGAHAVCRIDYAGDFLLDCRINTVKEWGKLPKFQPLYSFNRSSLWVGEDEIPRPENVSYWPNLAPWQSVLARMSLGQ